MNETAAHLVDRIIPQTPLRQWVLTLPADLARVVAFDSSLCASVFKIFADELARWHRDCARDDGIETPQAGSIMEVQRFADGLRLWIHAHVLAPQGVFYEAGDGQVRFHATRAPWPADVSAIVERVERRVSRLVEQRGLLQTGTSDNEEAATQGARLLLQCAASSPATRKKTAGARSQADNRRRHKHRLCRSSRTGFELHAGVTVGADDDRGRERICRYFGRPPIAQDRLSLTDDGRIEYHLKRTWKGGVTSLVFDPLTFIARLVALVPPPGFHMRRYYGVFAPNHPMRARIVPAPPDPNETGRPVAPKRPKSMAWADLLKRVYLIDVLKCPRPGCSGRLRYIATIHDPDAIHAIVAAVILSGDLDERQLGRAPP